jgi:predicted NBD/HSP70 family sugar kinase
MKTKGGRTFTGLTLHEKQKRSLAILELIRKKGVISRTDISRATGINVVSISHYINNFIDEKILTEKGLAASSGGRKPELIELNAKGHYCVGIDTCGAGFSAALTDIAMNCVCRKRTDAAQKRGQATEAIIGLVKDTVAASGIPQDKVRAVGIGVCTETLAGVGDIVEKETSIETYVGSQAACAAFAEKNFNKEAGVEKMLYIHSDLGRGILVDGGDCIGCVAQPVEGAAGSRAEARAESGEGIRYLDPWDETLGAVMMAKREVLRGVGTKIVSISGGNVKQITEATIIQAARQNDETALNIMQSIAVTLGMRIAYLINLFDPQAVIIGGGLEKAEEIVLPLIKKMVCRLSLKRLSGAVRILPASTPEDSLCMGAAALATREIFLKS